MIKICFVCHGNICRSPLAEFVMKKLVDDAHLSAQFAISSCATSTEEIGNGIYPPTQASMRKHGIPFDDHRAVQLCRADYDRFDYLICMDSCNISNIQRIIGSDPNHKVSRLLDFTDHPRDVADPWYTRDFERTYQDVLKGCAALLETLKNKL